MEQTLPSVEEEPKDEKEVKDTEEAKDTSKSDGITPYPEVMAKLEEFLQPADFEKFKTFIEQLKSGDVAKD